MHVISDIATDPNVSRKAGRGGRTIAEAVKEGINVRVIQESNGDIVSGFPTNVQGIKMKNEYREIESTLDLLLMVLSDSFSESESIEVQEFIDVGEYGIALETIIDIINEESKNITNEAEFLIEKQGG